VAEQADATDLKSVG